MPGRYKEGTVHWEESRQRWRAFVSVDGRRYSKRFLSRDEALDGHRRCGSPRMMDPS